MPSYKNELTEQIIIKAFERRVELKNRPYLQMQDFFGALCKMMGENGSNQSQKNVRRFDRDIYDQLLQESELIKSENLLLVTIERFVINLMRAEIALNEKLKSIHLHIQNLEEKLRQYHAKGRPANRFDQEFQQAQNLQKQIAYVRNQKKSTEEDLYYLRLAFIEEEELKKLTKKLQSSKSNPYFKPLESQIVQKQNINNSGPGYHAIGPDKNSPSKRITNLKTNDNFFTSIFVLTSMLIITQCIILVFYKNSFLNLIVFGFIMSMFVKQMYSKVLLKFFMVINGFSFVLELGLLLFVNKPYFWVSKSYLFQGPYQLQFYVLIVCVILLVGKLFLEILLVIQIFKESPQQITVSLCCISFRLTQIQGPNNEDIIHTTLVKSFS